MDPMWAEAIKLGVRAVLPPDVVERIFSEEGAYDRYGGAEGDGPDPRRTAALEEVKRKDGSVSLWIGTRATGKTIASRRQAEFMGREVYAVCPEERVPSWINQVTLADVTAKGRVPNHITLILDDLPVLMSNRDYNNQMVQTMEKIIPMCRHERKWHIIFNTQSSAQADKYILDCDLAFFKPLGILMDDAERPNIRRIYRNEVNPFFENRSEDFIHKHAYMKSRTYSGGISISKPAVKKDQVLLTEQTSDGVYTVVGETEMDARGEE